MITALTELHLLGEHKEANEFSWGNWGKCCVGGSIRIGSGQLEGFAVDQKREGGHHLKTEQVTHKNGIVTVRDLKLDLKYSVLGVDFNPNYFIN